MITGGKGLIIVGPRNQFLMNQSFDKNTGNVVEKSYLKNKHLIS